MDAQAITLYLIIKNPEEGLEYWGQLRPCYFTKDYLHIYRSISKFYDEHQKLPTFSELELCIRDKSTRENILALKNLKVEEIDLDLAVESLIDAYTQEEALEQIDSLLDKITLLSSEEVKQELNNIALVVEEKTNSSSEIFLMNDLLVYDEQELSSRVYLQFNNTFDAHIGGAAASELLMLGGYRGSGKSIVSVNIANAQYEQGNVGLFFTIEMRAQQIFRRMLSALARVSNDRLKKNICLEDELIRLAKTRADMFEDSEEVYQDFLSGKFHSYKDFEIALVGTKPLKKDNQIIIVDNQQLTIADIDVNIQKAKTRFGDKLKVVIVDYINQLAVQDMYDWKVQITLSKQLKDLAEKHNVVMVTPYQMDKSGEARFAKGILDAADFALTLHPENTYIQFKTSKIRDSAPINFASVMDWETLRLSPQEAILTEEKNTDTSSTLPF